MVVGSWIARSALMALMVALVGCGDGSTSSPPPSTDPTSVDPGTPDPGTTDPGPTDPGTTDPGTPPPPPTDATIDGDLRLHGIHCHQDFFHQNLAPKRLAFYWDVVNTSPTALDAVEWELRRTDRAEPLATGSFAVAANDAGHDGHDHVVVYDEPEVGTHEYLLTIDPANHVHERDESDNAYLFEIDVPTDPGWHPVPADDLHFVSNEAHFHDLLPNAGQLAFHFIGESTFAVPITGVQWRLRCASAGIDQTITVPGTIQPRTRFESSRAVTVPPGEYDFEMTLDPADRFSESDEVQNTRVFHVVAPPVTGG